MRREARSTGWDVFKGTAPTNCGEEDHSRPVQSLPRIQKGPRNCSNQKGEFGRYMGNMPIPHFGLLAEMPIFHSIQWNYFIFSIYEYETNETIYVSRKASKRETFATVDKTMSPHQCFASQWKWRWPEAISISITVKYILSSIFVQFQMFRRS